MEVPSGSVNNNGGNHTLALNYDAEYKVTIVVENDRQLKSDPVEFSVTMPTNPVQQTKFTTIIAVMVGIIVGTFF